MIQDVAAPPGPATVRISFISPNCCRFRRFEIVSIGLIAHDNGGVGTGRDRDGSDSWEDPVDRSMVEMASPHASVA